MNTYLIIGGLLLVGVIAVYVLYSMGYFSPKVDCIQTQWSTCNLVTRTQTRTTEKESSNGGAECGPLTKACYVAFNDTDYGGFDIPGLMSTVEDRQACEAKCDSDPSCNAYVYKESDKFCYPKTLTKESEPVLDKSMKTYYKGIPDLKPAKGYTLFENTAYHGFDHAELGGPIANIKSIDECETQCNKTSGCNAVLYSPSTSTCYRKTLTADSKPTFDTAFVTAYKGLLSLVGATPP
jgi:hypothetical protein